MHGRNSRSAVDADRSIPVLLVKVGRYPLHHGSVGAIRTLGRLGVPVYAVTEDRFTPAAVSRYLAGRFVWPTSGAEAPEVLVDGILERGRRIGGRPILLPTDDEAAVLVAEHTEALAARFLLPPVPPALPRTVADKATLYDLCRSTGTPAPASARPGSIDELLALADEITYPVVLKNAAPWARLRAPAVAGTTVVRGADDLRSIASRWVGMPDVLVQEYLPEERGRDWIVAAYCGAGPAPALVFTGRKTRSWPAHAGVTTRAFAAPNPALVSMTADLCRRIGYRGVADLDWRFDQADGRYKLLDFNPRVGAQFRLFETDAGIDVVRAMHLDLSGRAVPAGAQVDGRRLLVENLDLPAAWAYRRAGEGRAGRGAAGRGAAGRDGAGEGGAGGDAIRPGRTELAWLAVDDPLPALAAAARSVGPALALARRGRRR